MRFVAWSESNLHTVRQHIKTRRNLVIKQKKTEDFVLIGKSANFKLSPIILKC